MGSAADIGSPAKPRGRGAVSLDAELLAAQTAGDVEALIALYTHASEEAVTDIAKGVYLTHNYVFALESRGCAGGSTGRIITGAGPSLNPATELISIRVSVPPCD